jgi:hypothetical protein
MGTTNEPVRAVIDWPLIVALIASVLRRLTPERQP